MMKPQILRLSMLLLLMLVFGGCSPADLPNGPSTGPAQPQPHPQGWGVRTKTSGCVASGGLQDSTCTPGDILPSATRDAICRLGYARSVRNVPISEKDQVYREYGIASHTPGAYEVDHLVSLELGGSNDISNLWPEAAQPSPGFHEKDVVENYLHDAVCAGKLPLATAQEEIAQNWLRVYAQMQGQEGGEAPPQAPVQPQAPLPTAPVEQRTGTGGVPPDGAECPDDFPIKGNIRSDKTKIYHVPGDATYYRTRPEQCFATTADAEAAGFRPPR